jgi:hypothetical protein
MTVSENFRAKMVAVMKSSRIAHSEFKASADDTFKKLISEIKIECLEVSDEKNDKEDNAMCVHPCTLPLYLD